MKLGLRLLRPCLCLLVVAIGMMLIETQLTEIEHTMNCVQKVAL